METVLGHFSPLRGSPWASNLRSVSPASLSVQQGTRPPLQRSWKDLNETVYVRSVADCCIIPT